MTNEEKADLLRELRGHLKDYRTHRWNIGLAAARNQEPSQSQRDSLSFHAVRLAECLDRLNGSTR